MFSDMNQDNLLEVVVNEIASANGRTHVYEWQGDGFTGVIAATCRVFGGQGEGVVSAEPTAVPTEEVLVFSPPERGVTYPILIGQVIVGGVRNEKWVNYEQAAEGLAAGTQYRTYAGEHAWGEEEKPMAFAYTSTGAAPAYMDSYLQVAMSPYRLWPYTISSTATWDLFLRPSIEVESLEFRPYIVTLLEENGLQGSTAQIEEAWKLDFEGDGAYEIVLFANRPMSSELFTTARAGHYAIVVILKPSANGYEVIPVIEEYYYEDGQNHANPTNAYEFDGGMDLNGDGVMELIIHGSHFDGYFTEIYEVRPRNARLLFGFGISMTWDREFFVTVP